jgi:hypothetical protein
MSADRGGEIDDAPRLGCRHRRVGQVQLRLIALGLGLLETRNGAAALRVERFDLPLRNRKDRLRRPEGRLLLVQLRSILLGVLRRAGTFLCQRLVTRRLLLREYEVRLRLLHLCLTGVDLRLLHRDLRIDVLDIGLRGRHLSLGLLDGDAVIALIDARDRVAGGDVLVIRHRHCRDVARHLRRHRKDARRDEGIIGRLEMPRVVPIEVPGGKYQRQQDRAAGRDGDRMAASEILVRIVPGRIPGLLCVVGVFCRWIYAAWLAILRRSCLDRPSCVEYAKVALSDQCQRRRRV